MCAFFFLFHFVFIIRRIVCGVVLTIAAIISILWKCFSEIRFSADVARFYALRPFFDYFLIFFRIPAQFYSLFSAFSSFSTQLNFRISFIFVFCKVNCVCLYSVYGMTSIALFFLSSIWSLDWFWGVFSTFKLLRTHLQWKSL